MRLKAQISSTIFISIIALAATNCPARGADTGSDRPPVDMGNLFQGIVNTAGEIRDQSGRTLGKVIMNEPTSTFNLQTMTINRNGNVIDSSGVIVGHVKVSMENKAGAPPPVAGAPPAAPPPPAGMTNVAPEPAAAAPPTSPPASGFNAEAAGSTRLAAPEQTVQQREVVVPPAYGRPGAVEQQGSVQRVMPSGAREYTGQTVIERQPPAAAPRMQATQEKAVRRHSVLTGMRDDDLTGRRARVQSSIENELAQGRITNDQAADLEGRLQMTAQAQAAFERRGVLRDKDVRNLYRAWDDIMGRLDDDLSRNARRAIGLRTK